MWSFVCLFVCLTCLALFICLFVTSTLGGGLFGILGKYTNKFGKDPVVLLGMLVHFVAYYLAYANLPALSIADKVTSGDSFGTIFNPSK